MADMSQTISSTDQIICHCFKVTESTVRDCIELYQAESLTEVRSGCGAGSGCMACRRRIQCLIESYRSGTGTTREE